VTLRQLPSTSPDHVRIELAVLDSGKVCIIASFGRLFKLIIFAGN